MKDEKGITLTSLVIYVIVMIIVIGVMNVIINNFYNNLEDVHVVVQEIIEFNKFNISFLKEIKAKENNIDNIGAGNSYILFKSGNAFVFNNNKIYYNDIEICKNVVNASFENLSDEEEQIIKVSLDFENYKKSINYKIENIY